MFWSWHCTFASGQWQRAAPPASCTCASASCRTQGSCRERSTHEAHLALQVLLVGT
jgi:hypothetical protein